MSDFIQSLIKFREAGQSIDALLKDIDHIVKDKKESPILLLAEFTHENIKNPLLPKDIKAIKNRIVTVSKLQNDKKTDSIELDDTVDINQSDTTIELDIVDNTEDLKDSATEDIIENAEARHGIKEIPKTPANKDTSSADAAPRKQIRTDLTKLEGRILNDRYTLEKCLGSGGMGTVYRAIDRNELKPGIGTPYVAVKIFHHNMSSYQNSFQNLRKEVNRFQQFTHPNIVDIHEINLDHDIVYLVMEYLTGKTLKDEIQASDFEGLPLQEALPIIRGMGEALAFAHDHGVVHYDFKPSNVIITDDGQIKVIDFGIARAYKGTVQDDASLPNSAALTPVYASAEMLERQAPDPRDDIYALGSTVYELLTGNHPFNRKRATQARDAGLQPQQPEELTPVEWEALKETLSFERRDRTLNVKDFLKSLNVYGRSKTANTSLLKGAAAASVIAIMATSSYLIVVDSEIRDHFDSMVSSIGFGAKDVARDRVRAPLVDKLGDTETDIRASDLSQQSDENADFAAIGEKKPENR